MKNFCFENSSRHIIDTLERVLSYGESMGLNLKSASAKLNSIKAVLNDKTIKIAFIGRFSDGKTSVLAALLGQKFDNMKIGIDETSDELLQYKSGAIGDGVEIVDTPGLFGTKEKEVDGEMLRLSEKTERYLSQAHIITYVCDAKNPIKNTHESIIFDVLRKYNKLGVTIFVLNKMDKVCDLEDEEDYEYNSSIKKQWLIDGLKRAISLTDQEANEIRCVCISADPNRESMEYCFSTPEYETLSRINLLKHSIATLLDSVNREELHKSNLISASKDFISLVSSISETEIGPQENTLIKAQDNQIDIKNDVDSFRSTLGSRRHDLRDALEKERMHYYSIVQDATVETFDEVMFKYFGIQDENGNFSVLSNNIDDIFENIIGSSKELEVRCKKNVELLNKEAGFFDDILDKYGSKIGGFKVDNKMVKAGRNYVAPNVKLKPWGAVKIADKINKGIAGIGFIIEAWKAWKAYKAEKELDKIKIQLKEYLGEFFNAWNAFIKDDDNYYTLYPAFVELVRTLEKREQELQVCQRELTKLREYQERIHKLLESNIEDVEFEDI